MIYIYIYSQDQERTSARTSARRIAAVPATGVAAPAYPAGGLCSQGGGDAICAGPDSIAGRQPAQNRRIRRTRRCTVHVLANFQIPAGGRRRWTSGWHGKKRRVGASKTQWVAGGGAAGRWPESVDPHFNSGVRTSASDPLSIYIYACPIQQEIKLNSILVN